MPKAVLERLRAQVTFSRDHGSVKEMITAETPGVRMVAVGKEVRVGRPDEWKCFPDFLRDYLRQSIWTKETWEAECAKPAPERHPVMRWYDCLVDAQQRAVVDVRGRTLIKNGSANAFFRLAYDLYLNAHNTDLSTRLLHRLRDPNQFQGARFELAVAAMMLTAGYELQFFNDKGPGQRVEFFGVHKTSGRRLAVEAKSKHRPGVMCFERHRSRTIPAKGNVHDLVRAAVLKAPAEPLLIFTELNVPFLANQADALASEIRDSWAEIVGEEWPEGFPAVGVIFYNDASPWFETDDVPDGPFIWCAGHSAANRHGFDGDPLLRQISVAISQRCNTPEEFRPNP